MLFSYPVGNIGSTNGSDLIYTGCITFMDILLANKSRSVMSKLDLDLK